MILFLKIEYWELWKLKAIFFRQAKEPGPAIIKMSAAFPAELMTSADIGADGSAYV